MKSLTCIALSITVAAVANSIATPLEVIEFDFDEATQIVRDAMVALGHPSDANSRSLQTTPSPGSASATIQEAGDPHMKGSCIKGQAVNIPQFTAQGIALVIDAAGYCMNSGASSLMLTCDGKIPSTPIHLFCRYLISFPPSILLVSIL